MNNKGFKKEGTGLHTGNVRAGTLMLLPCSLPGIRGWCVLQVAPWKWNEGEGVDLPVLFLVHFSWQVCPTVGATGLGVFLSDGARERARLLPPNTEHSLTGGGPKTCP